MSIPSLNNLYAKFSQLGGTKEINIDNRPQYNPYELHRVGATIFGELSNKGDQDSEARNILSTIVNRANEGKMSLQAVISQPKQYQAFGGNQYQRYLKGNLDVPSQKKAAIVSNLISELESGKFNPVTDAKYFIHDANQNIQVSKKFKQ